MPLVSLNGMNLTGALPTQTSVRHRSSPKNNIPVGRMAGLARSLFYYSPHIFFPHKVGIVLDVLGLEPASHPKTRASLLLEEKARCVCLDLSPLSQVFSADIFLLYETSYKRTNTLQKSL